MPGGLLLSPSDASLRLLHRHVNGHHVASRRPGGNVGCTKAGNGVEVLMLKPCGECGRAGRHDKRCSHHRVQPVPASSDPWLEVLVPPVDDDE